MGGRAAGLAALRELVAATTKGSGFGRVLSGLEVREWERDERDAREHEGRLLLELELSERHANPGGALHGGLSATLVDYATTIALVQRGAPHPGVSVDLNVTYLRPALVGSSILIDARILKFGRSLAFTTCDIRTKHDNALVAQGRHTKAFPKSS